jgi:PTH1 family peptidyl-tRNA hydrolase
MGLFGRRGAAAERRGTPADLLVVGLGNPGADYAGTRHNIGAEVVRLLAARHGGTLQRGRERSDVTEVRVDRPGSEAARVALAVPHTYMNLSGEAVSPLVRRFGIEDPARLVVVHDELDLEPGRLKVKSGGGLAGHNGLRSIKSHLHTQDFLRVRVGVGKPPAQQAGKDHVLRRPGKAERAELDIAAEDAADAVDLILQEGVEAAMTKYNAR